jgi:predicted alternative tryptophan synthase beta-subunit
MGLNTWAAFAGRGDDAMVAGDVAMLEHEVTPVLKALRAHGIDIVAIHHHMTQVKPVVMFLHYFGAGPATKLAQAVRAAVDQTGKRPASDH